MIKNINGYHVNDIYYYDKIILYDTNKGHYKTLCVANKGNYKVLCILIRCEQNSWNEIKTKKLESYTTLFSINEDNCYSIGFYSEFLLCCEEKEQTSCIREDISF